MQKYYGPGILLRYAVKHAKHYIPELLLYSVRHDSQCFWIPSLYDARHNALCKELSNALGWFFHVFLGLDSTTNSVGKFFCSSKLADSLDQVTRGR
jgi:hypothetical protein